MSKYDARHFSQGDLRYWAGVLAGYGGDEYDPDCDAPANVYCAWCCVSSGTPNFESACTALLNQWQRKDAPEPWDAGLEFLRENRLVWTSSARFETDAEKFLDELGKKYPRPAKSPRPTNLDADSLRIPQLGHDGTR